MDDFYRAKRALLWAEQHLPEEKYQEINTAYDKTLVRTLLFVLLCILPLIIVGTFILIEAPFSKRAEIAATPDGATEYVLARIDYDGNFYWTHDSKVYEYALKDYGLSPEKFEFGDKVKVYIDDAQNIIKVFEVKDGPNVRDIEVFVATIIALLLPSVLCLCVYLPIARYTFGKAWYDFMKEYRKR